MKTNTKPSVISRLGQRKLFVMSLIGVAFVLLLDFLTIASFNSFPRDIETLVETQGIYTVFEEWYSYIGYFFGACFYLILLGCMCVVYLLHAWDNSFHLISFLMIWHSSLGIISTLGRIGQMLSSLEPHLFSNVAEGMSELSFLPLFLCIVYYMDKSRKFFVPLVLADCFCSSAFLFSLLWNKEQAYIYVSNTLSDWVYFLCLAVAIVLAIWEVKNQNEDFKYFFATLFFSSIVVVLFLFIVVLGKNGFSIKQTGVYISHLHVNTGVIRTYLANAILFLQVSSMIVFNSLREYHVHKLSLQSMQMRDEANLEYAKNLQRYETKVREIKHDIVNTFHVASTLCENGEYARLSDYLATVTGQISSVKTGQFCSHILINYLLLMFKERFDKTNTEFRCHAILPSSLEIDDNDISRVLNNALQNAFDAVQMMPEQERWVEITIRKDAKVVRIDCCNPYKKEPILADDGSLLTSKKDRYKHGLGMSIIHDIAQKYGGVAVPLFSNGIFDLKIALPDGKSS